MMSAAVPPMAAATPSGQLTRTRLAGRPPLQQTANHDDDKLRTWQGYVDFQYAALSVCCSEELPVCCSEELVRRVQQVKRK
jgi:hypothetical protein